jgi:hypothetical protein
MGNIRTKNARLLKLLDIKGGREGGSMYIFIYTNISNFLHIPIGISLGMNTDVMVTIFFTQFS